MPWHVAQTAECPASRPWGVIRDSNGHIEGCHPNEDAANQQMAALYASEANAKWDAVMKYLDIFQEE